jgi:hypothetical protein
MPLTEKGTKIMAAMKDDYGSEKGEKVFYASENKGTIKGVHKGEYHGNMPISPGKYPEHPWTSNSRS